MQYTTLGRSGLEVSRICFGSWQFGGDWGAVEREEAIAAVRRALDLGVTFFDTAQAYGFGESEALLAEAARRRPVPRRRRRGHHGRSPARRGRA